MKSRFTLALSGILLFFAVPAMAEPAMTCPAGTYRLADGSVVDIAPSERDTLRWRILTGETGQLHKQMNGTWTSTYGWTDRPDGKMVSFSDCGQGEITFGKESGRRIPFLCEQCDFRKWWCEARWPIGYAAGQCAKFPWWC